METKVERGGKEGGRERGREGGRKMERKGEIGREKDGEEGRDREGEREREEILLFSNTKKRKLNKKSNNLELICKKKR